MRALLRAIFYPLPKPGDIYAFDEGAKNTRPIEG